jgi:4-hydroxybenzoate polyprenyltransferase
MVGNGVGAFAALLLFSILFYDAVHKMVGFAPVLMGACRFFLYLAAAAGARDGVTGLAIWGGLALGAYVTGLSYLARHERSRRGLPRWPVFLLAVPHGLALVANAGDYRLRAALLVFLAALWLLVCLQPAFMTRDLNVGRAVSGLLAGIPLIDLLAVAGLIGPAGGLLLAALFVGALSLQRWVPAT